ncbi:hypothetical protein CP8484711_1561A, partial [Chlamydia psittaci 84-8471/1]
MSICVTANKKRLLITLFV